LSDFSPAVGLVAHAERRIIEQRIGIIVVAPVLRSQQHAGANERGEVIQPTMPFCATMSRKSTAPGPMVSLSTRLSMRK